MSIVEERICSREFSYLQPYFYKQPYFLPYDMEEMERRFAGE